MKISAFTEIELANLRKSCNFVGNERDVFDLRSQGVPLELIAEQINLSVDGVKKISRKVNKKIMRVQEDKTMTREEAIVYWRNHFETGNTEQNDAVCLALEALENAMIVYDKDELYRIVARTVKF